MPVTVRPFEPDDVPPVAALRRRVFQHGRRAGPGRHADVLRQLFRHATRAGAMAVRGRHEPAFDDALRAAGCLWERQGQGMLVHARDPALLASVLRGDALLSGLDGEWWLDF